MIANKLIQVGDVFKTGYLCKKKGKNPIYHEVVAVYWDNLSKETLYELHYLKLYLLDRKEMDYIKFTILANEDELNKFSNLGNVRI